MRACGPPGANKSSLLVPDCRLNFLCMDDGAPLPAAAGRVVHISMRPTMSVVDTPSVRLIILKRPAFLALA